MEIALGAASRSGEEMVRELDTLQLAQPVGTTFQYSHIIYGIAGLIVEKVSGHPYVDYVTQHIFELLVCIIPTHLARSRWVTD